MIPQYLEQLTIPILRLIASLFQVKIINVMMIPRNSLVSEIQLKLMEAIDGGLGMYPIAKQICEDINDSRA